MMDQGKKATPTVKKSFNPFWDHVLFWEVPDVTIDKFEYGKIEIALYDTSTTLRSALIGTCCTLLQPGVSRISTPLPSV